MDQTSKEKLVRLLYQAYTQIWKFDDQAPDNVREAEMDRIARQWMDTMDVVRQTMQPDASKEALVPSGFMAIEARHRMQRDMELAAGGVPGHVRDIRVAEATAEFQRKFGIIMECCDRDLGIMGDTDPLRSFFSNGDKGNGPAA